jgi:hypothetical protein
MESLVYFQIREDWEEVPITKVFFETKVVPNCIFYHQDFFQIFIPTQLGMLRSDSGKILLHYH